jgi:hypothetical protein
VLRDPVSFRAFGGSTYILFFFAEVGPGEKGKNWSAAQCHSKIHCAYLKKTMETRFLLTARKRIV